jgi:hypothetical protein
MRSHNYGNQTLAPLQADVTEYPGIETREVPFAHYKRAVIEGMWEKTMPAELYDARLALAGGTR